MFTVCIRYYLGDPLNSPTILRWGVATWALDLAVNLLGTLAIAARLWWIGRQAAPLKPGNRNTYLGIAFIILESGTMFSLATLILVILFVNTQTSQGAIAGINVVMQLAVSEHTLVSSA